MVSSVALRGCLRCDGPLDLYDRFPRCVHCGWEDYRDHDELRNGGSLGSSSNPSPSPTEWPTAATVDASRSPTG